MDLLLHLQHPFHPPQSLLLVLLSEQNLRNRRGPLGGGPEDHGASNDGAVIGGSKNRKNRAHCRFCRPVIPRWGAVCGPTKKTLLLKRSLYHFRNNSYFEIWSETLTMTPPAPSRSISTSAGGLISLSKVTTNSRFIVLLNWKMAIVYMSTNGKLRVF